jgi:hypothetical protein
MKIFKHTIVETMCIDFSDSYEKEETKHLQEAGYGFVTFTVTRTKDILTKEVSYDVYSDKLWSNGVEEGLLDKNLKNVIIKEAIKFWTT